MKLSYEDHDRISVVTLSGELTSDQADVFRRACLDRMEASIREIVLDLEHLTLIDSSGLELLLWLTDTLASRSGQLRLVNPDDTIRTILKITRLDRRFGIHETIEAAAKSLR